MNNVNTTTQIKFQTPEIPFLTKEIPFLTKEIPFLTKEIPFLTKEIPFLTKENHFLTKENHFLTKENHFLTKENHFLTKELRTDFMTRTPVLVCDAVCGMGKTQSAIDYINNSSSHVKFLYVTPFLTEVQRIIDSCPSKKFKQPVPKNSNGSKRDDFCRLIRNGENIVCTHALFSNFEPQMFDELQAQSYILILDEVADVVQTYNINSKDMNIILSEYTNPKTKETRPPLAHVEEDGKIVWDDDKYYGTFNEIKDLSMIGSLYKYNDCYFVWTFPTSIFNYFTRVFILTYMFSGQMQCNYYQLNEVEYKYLHVVKEDENGNRLPDDFFAFQDETKEIHYHFEDKIFDGPQKVDVSYYKERIHIEDSLALNRIGGIPANSQKKSLTQLSKNWYIKASNESIKQLKNNLYNYFRNIRKCSTSDFMWTTFEKYSSKIVTKGFKGSFVPLNARATNIYANKTSLAYMANRYMEPVLLKFFEGKDVYVEEDTFALSELIQWIFRSAIRQGKDVYIYIPSKRMRELLESWE